MSRVDVLVLGPVALRVDGRVVAPSARGIRALLGALAVAGESGASDTELAEQLWGVPDNDSGLRVLVHRTRAWLRRVAGSAVAVVRTPSGYALRLESGQRDLDRFTEMVATASALQGVERAVALQSALALWRGPISEADDSRASLEQERVRVVVDCAQTWLAAGQAARAVTLLEPIADQYPLDERAHSVWMESLAATGRQADALAAYESLRVRLREEFGIDPSRQVSRALTRVLRQEVPSGSADGGDGLLVPAQLPAVAGTFVGRHAELRRLDTLLANAGDGSPEMAVGVIVGAGGVGKTTLAVRWAHRVADRFPDGQLHIDLRGYSGGQPVRPIDGLARFLHAFGIPADGVPADVDEAAALFRSTLGGRRVLIVLDNALHAGQVRPLLPGSPGCLVLVTSRDRMDGLVALNGAMSLRLDVLEPDDAIRLLSETVGARRVHAELAAAADIARACAYLPLALRVVGAHMIARPHLPLVGYAAQLCENDRLTTLAVDGDEHATVAATFAQSYHRLDADQRQMFRLLGLIPGADVTPAAAAVLAGCGEGEARVRLSGLAMSHLVTEHATDRYTCHDLLRAYATRIVNREETATDRDAALARLFDWYLAAGHAAAARLFPQLMRLPLPTSAVDIPVPRFDSPAAASGWLEQERGNLVAAALQAARQGCGHVTWLLADALRMYFLRWRHTGDALQLAEAALAAAEDAGDLGGQAASELGLATARASLGEFPVALEHCQRAADLSRRASWIDGEVGALANQAILHTDLGNLDVATRYLERCRALNQRLGNVAREAALLNNLGTVHLSAGRLAAAVACHRDALAIYRGLGDPSYEHITLHSLGVALRELGELDEAAELFERKLATIKGNGELHGEAGAFAELAKIHCDRLRFDEAYLTAESALRTAQRTRDRLNETNSRIRLAEACHHRGRLAEASEHGRRAIELARQIGNARLEVDALIATALTDSAHGRHGDALRGARQALARCHECGLTLAEGRALAALARIQLAAGQAHRAVELARLALENSVRTGSRLNQAKAGESLAECLLASGDHTEAARLRESARRTYTELGIGATNVASMQGHPNGSHVEQKLADPNAPATCGPSLPLTPCSG